MDDDFRFGDHFWGCLAVVTLRKFYMHMLAYACHKPGCDSKRCHQGVPNTFHEPIRIVSGDDKEYER